MHPTMTRSARLSGAIVAVLLAAGCASGNPSSTPTWVPQPDFQANSDPRPQLPRDPVPAPEPSRPGGPTPGGPSGTPRVSPSPFANSDPAVVATNLDQPTGLVVLPDGTALVGERTTGRILRVQPTAGQPVRLVQTLAGVDGAGDGGLLDLAISPTFNQDGLIYAYLSTATDNRVVHFAVGSAPSPVLVGIPRGRTGNVGRIAFDGTGALLIGTGDAGRPALAASPTSLAGKILRTDDIGKPAVDNPHPGSLLFASGLRSVDGLCADSASGSRVAISAGAPDEVNVIKPNGSYGWPTASAGSSAPAKTLPAATTGGGGCALVKGRLVVATSTGKSLLAASLALNGSVSNFDNILNGKYGRLRTVVAGSDGGLWLTTRNRDGQGKPIAADDRVIRIPQSQAGGSSVV